MCPFSQLYILFGCPQANFGPLTKRQFHSTDVNHTLVSSFTPWSPGALPPTIFCYAWCTMYFESELSSLVALHADRYISSFWAFLVIFQFLYLPYCRKKIIFPKSKEKSIGDMNLHLNTQNHKDQMFCQQAMADSNGRSEGDTQRSVPHL